MPPNIAEAKKALRAQVRARWGKVSADDRVLNSARARTLLTSQPIWEEAQSILFFAPMPEELDIWPLLTDALSSGKVAALPRFDGNVGGYVACRILDTAKDLSTGRFAIREPNIDCVRCGERVDLILVPGVAFDLRGGRLGRGAGYYDRLLANLQGPRCGGAFDEQIVEGIPAEPHDLKMDYVLTPTRWVRV